MITAEQAKELLAAATPGPWVTSPSKYVSGHYVHPDRPNPPTIVHATEAWAGPADARLIAAAPDLAQTVIDLYAKLDSAVSELGRAL